MKKSFLSLTLSFSLFLTVAHAASSTLTASFAGRYNSGFFNLDGGVMEISAYDKTSKRLYSVNGNSGNIHVINLTIPSNPTFINTISIAPYGAAANSVSVKNNILAVAVEAVLKQDSGKVVFFNANDGTFLKSVTVGALPDMLTFTPDGTKVLVANEGEPSDDYTNDPEGCVSIIDISAGVLNATVSHAGFNSFDASKTQLINKGVRIYGINATVSKDMEPEYIAVSEDSKTAWVTCQENNAIAIVDLATKTVTDIKPLGYKDYNAVGNGIDASDRYPSNPSTQINIKNWPVKGMYQPDGIASMVYNNKVYLITANEGDARAYTALNEEARISTLTLDPTIFPTASTLKNNASLGRLKVTNKLGDIDGDNDFDVLYSYGARSFSVWNDTIAQVFDSGDDIEQYVAANYPANFNVNHNTTNQKSDRSDDKGPEPETVITAKIDNKTYAFIGLERQSAILIYDVTNPTSPIFEQYLSSRDFSQTPVSTSGTGVGTGGDLGPEGLLFIPATESPNGKDLLIVSYEVSGSVSIYELNTTDTKVTDVVGNGKLSVSQNSTNNTTLLISETIENGQILNSLGNKVVNVNHTNQINISNFKTGVYFLKSNNGKTVKFFVKN
ncbi:MAG: choice-of-anchor I family protein [Bacteroidales bacterium]